MTPRDIEIMVEAARAEQDRDWQYRDALNGKLCATIAEPYRDKDQHPDPFTAADFMIMPKDQVEEQTVQEPQEMIDEQIRKSISTMKNWVATTGGKHG